MKREKVKHQLFSFWILILFLCSFLLLVKWVVARISYNKEQKAIEEYYNSEPIIEEIQKNEFTASKNKEKLKYIGVIEIPKINLRKGLVHPQSVYNDVNYNIKILDSSDSPDTVNGNFILAAHSGNSNISFFKDLDKLSVADKVKLSYNKNEYEYKVVDIYDIEKVGTANIKRNQTKRTLTLITCRRNTNKQIVIICELEKKWNSHNFLMHLKII